jgi:Mu-like prophage I protein
MKYKASSHLQFKALRVPSGIPEGHLELINAKQRVLGKSELSASDIIVRPVRLTGNQLTDYYTKFPDLELAKFAEQINTDRAALLIGHDTDEDPSGTFYAASVTDEMNGLKWLDTWVYWLNDDEGLKLARDIDSGIINEASIGFNCENWICSITGGSYWQSPYMAGREYDIMDTTSGLTLRVLCFVWMYNCELNEGSLVYKGAHPGTRVGGTIPGFNDTAPAPAAYSTSHAGFAVPASAHNAQVLAAMALRPPQPPRFTLSVDDNLAKLLQKADRNLAISNPPPSTHTASSSLPPAMGREEDAMNKLQLAKLLGLPETASDADIEAEVSRLNALGAQSASITQLTGRSSAHEALGVITAWKAGAEKLGVVNTELETMKTAQKFSKMEALKAQGLSAGRFTPAEYDALFSKQEPEMLEAFLNTSSTTVTPAKPEHVPPSVLGANVSGLSDEDRAIIKMTGVDPVQYSAQKAALEL